MRGTRAIGFEKAPAIKNLLPSFGGVPSAKPETSTSELIVVAYWTRLPGIISSKGSCLVPYSLPSFLRCFLPPFAVTFVNCHLLRFSIVVDV